MSEIEHKIVQNEKCYVFSHIDSRLLTIFRTHFLKIYTVIHRFVIPIVLPCYSTFVYLVNCFIYTRQFLFQNVNSPAQSKMEI